MSMNDDNNTVHLNCIATTCIHNTVSITGNEEDLYCNLKRIAIKPDGVCAPMVLHDPDKFNMEPELPPAEDGAE